MLLFQLNFYFSIFFLHISLILILFFYSFTVVVVVVVVVVVFSSLLPHKLYLIIKQTTKNKRKKNDKVRGLAGSDGIVVVVMVDSIFKVMLYKRTQRN